MQAVEHGLPAVGEALCTLLNPGAVPCALVAIQDRSPDDLLTGDPFLARQDTQGLLELRVGPHGKRHRALDGTGLIPVKEGFDALASVG